MTLKQTIFSFLAASAITFCASTLTAQNLFSPAITVNDSVVTWYEIDQRAKFYKTIQRLGDLNRISRDELVDDRLRVQAGNELGISLTDEDVAEGMSEFAERANLTTDQFVAALAKEGVDRETFQDFVRAGLVWRQVVGVRFQGRVQVSDSEIDAALGAAGQAGLRVLLSEIVIPITPQTEDQVLEVANQISNITSEDQFARAAAQFSAASSRTNGGRLTWLPLSQLPPAIQGVILELKPGEVTVPIELERAVAIFRMRGIDELPRPAPSYAAIEYAVLRLAGGKSPETLAAAEQLKENIDTCDDLYGVNFGGPDEALTIDAFVPSEIPRDIAVELAKLDRHEVSTALTSRDGSQLLFIMLCGRTTAVNEETNRADVANALRNRRLESYANGYLEQLRAEANIVEK